MSISNKVKSKSHKHTLFPIYRPVAPIPWHWPERSLNIYIYIYIYIYYFFLSAPRRNDNYTSEQLEHPHVYPTCDWKRHLDKKTFFLNLLPNRRVFSSSSFFIIVKVKSVNVPERKSASTLPTRNMFAVSGTPERWRWGGWRGCNHGARETWCVPVQQHRRAPLQTDSPSLAATFTAAPTARLRVAPLFVARGRERVA